MYVWVESEGGVGGGGQIASFSPSKSLLGHSYKAINKLPESPLKPSRVALFWDALG